MRMMIVAALLPLAACGALAGDEGVPAQGTGAGDARGYALADFSKVN
jgi:hypothetical protein